MSQPIGADDRAGFALTTFMVALYEMTPEQRANASAEKAVARYGIRQDYAEQYIELARRTNERWPITGGMDGKRKSGRR